MQGGDTLFTEGVLNKGIFQNIYGYACWNTAGNTIGTALPHGILYGISKEVSKVKIKNKVKKRMEYAQTWFIFNRLLDDFTYHSIVRPKVSTLIKQNKWNAFRLNDVETGIVKYNCLKELQPLAVRLAEKLNFKIADLTFDLPWNRTFEAEIDFTIKK